MISDDRQRIHISKFLSLILRHEAAKFGVTLDKHGFADVTTVLAVLQRSFAEFTYDDLLDLAARDAKGRFDVSDGKIRARYGHSIYVEPRVAPAEPPDLLYHGTAEGAVGTILGQGLRPMRRRFVHLSPAIDDARKVGRRHSQSVAILIIRAKEAHDAGVRFFAEHNIYLAEYIPADFIDVLEKKT